MPNAAERNRRYRERIRKGLVQPRPRAPRPLKPPPSVADQLTRLIAAMPMPRELRLSAPCRGRRALFDPQREGEHRLAVMERHAAAIEFCSYCRLLDVCRRWTDSLPSGQRPIGVVAGQVIQPDYRKATP